MMYSDAYLEHFADRYIELGLRAYGITLEQYLAKPEACERVAREWNQRTVGGAAMIVPQRLSVIEAHLQAEAEAERGLKDVALRGDRYIEPLHHHRYTHTAGRRLPGRRHS